MKWVNKLAYALEPIVNSVWFLILLTGVVLAQLFVDPMVLISSLLVLMMVFTNLVAGNHSKRMRVFYYILLVLVLFSVGLHIVALFG
ncbi:hypothetical protein ACRHK7_01715 [Weissella tructae]|jgi:hypothetical protein|uniref:Uncharacterized protein n=2 Tax=Weissella TaxID=46255 RepID=A0A075TWI4_9LACO|nr:MULTISPECIES: hypothetical protein [Weissella]AIG65889.1 hypothetical protein WS08_0950 [Weissella tructae]AIM63268.1 hypothetical protein WS74_1016 [Weissella ceti]AIM64602.1 hypothetical protein WS105_1012 [Weissella ceti]ELA07260.1 hypothetical protein WCNC_02347 [Weissella ceti NC36]QVV91048.1 hypothetical protein KHQ32_05325 [Weissella tructae]